MALHKICQHFWYPKMFPFGGYQLDGNFFCFFFTFTCQSICRSQKWLALSCSWIVDKVRNACKVWACKLFLSELLVQTQFINKNCSINETKMVHVQDAFTDLYNTFLVMTWTLCMPGEQYILGIIWPTKNNGYSISAKSYDFCRHLRKLDIIDLTLSHTPLI